MPEKLKELPGTDEEVTSDNWREVQLGDYVWYVPEDAKTVDDVKLCVVSTPAASLAPDQVSVYIIENAPYRTVRRGRLSLAEPCSENHHG